MGGVNWPQMLNGAVWIPLVLMFLLRAERGYRPSVSALFSGFFLGVMWLAGHHQIQVFTSLAVALFWLYFFLRRGAPAWHMARLAVLCLGFAVLTSGLQTIPTAEYGPRSVRWSGVEEPLRFDQRVPYNVHAQYALKPEQVPGIVVPMLNGGYDPFLGIIAFSFLVTGAIAHWREPWPRWMAILGAAGILLALGPNSLLHGLAYALVPLVEKVRVPASAIALFCAAAVPLIAAGIDRLREPARTPWLRRLPRILAGTGAVLALASLLFYAARVPLQITDGRLMMTALFALGAAVLIAARVAGGVAWRPTALALLVLVLLELANETGFAWQNTHENVRPRFLPVLRQYADLIQYVREQDEPARIEYEFDEIKPNIGLWYGVPTMESYVASAPADVWRHDIFHPRTRDLLGIRYSFASKPRRPDQVLVFSGRDGLNVYRNPGAYDRVFTVHEAETLGTEAEAVTRLKDPAFDPRNATFLLGEAAPLLDRCAGDVVQIKRYEPDTVEIEADMKCRGMVILTDTWFPGWKATVDGKPAPIHQAYAMVRGVTAGAGRRLIRMTYRPRSVAIGAVMTATAFACALVVAIGEWRRRTARGTATAKTMAD
jgi:hypothetical protein